MDEPSSGQRDAIEEGNQFWDTLMNRPEEHKKKYAPQPSAVNNSEAADTDESASGDQSPLLGGAPDSKSATVREFESGDQPPTSDGSSASAEPSAPPPPTPTPPEEPKVAGDGEGSLTQALAWFHRNAESNPSIQDRRTMSPAKKIYLCSFFAFAVLVTIVALLAFSLKKVSSTDLGVQYDVHAKQLNDAIKSGGLFLGPPGYQFIKFPSTFIDVDLKNRICVSNDGLLVKFSVKFQYQMTAKNVLPAILKYRDFHKWASMVEQAGLSAIHHSCSEFFVSEFQNKRGVIQSKMEDNLRLKLEGDEASGAEGVHAVAVSLQLTFLELPEKYNDAVSERQKAKEDIELAVKERAQNITKANTALGAAREEVRKIEDTANNEAEVLLTEASLKAQETLFSFQKEAEALVEVKEKLNFTTEGLLAYLSTKLMSEASGLKVTTGEPAKMSQRDEL